MDKKRVLDFLEGRDMDALVFQLVDLYSREVIVWGMEDIIYEINRDTSSEWSEYTVEDWVDGWAEWCEGDVYSMYSIVDSRDGYVLNKPFAYVNPTYQNRVIQGIYSNDNLNLNASEIMDMEDPIIKTVDIDSKETYILQIGQVPYFYANREDRDCDYAKVAEAFPILRK